MNTPLRLGLSIALCLLLSGCAAGNLPDYIKLGDLRILALPADNPEIDPGAGTLVTITPIVSDLTANRSLSYSAEGCIDPGVGLGASPTCVPQPDRRILQAGSIPALSSANHTGPATAVTLVVPSNIFGSGSTLRSPQDQFNGVAYLVVYTLTATDTSGNTSQVTAFKRIIASASTHLPKNNNPVLSDVQAGGISLLPFLTALAYPGSTQAGVTLSPVFGAGSAESFSMMTANTTLTTQTETLTTTWFLSDGDLKFFRTLNTDSNTWTPPSTKPTGHGIVFVVVTRDGRGGETFKQVEY